MISKLQGLVNELELAIPKHEMIKPNVSKVSVGWQIEHGLLVINGIIEAVKHSDPKSYKWKFNLLRLFVFTMGKIQRGRAQSPERVRPKNNFNIEILQAHVYKTKENIKLGLIDKIDAHFLCKPIQSYLVGN